nr:MAG TPA: hypothetical protein [Caudoviricetes sp.]
METVIEMLIGWSWRQLLRAVRYIRKRVCKR